jgi:hypothetical protein
MGIVIAKFLLANDTVTGLIFPDLTLPQIGKERLGQVFFFVFVIFCGAVSCCYDSPSPWFCCTVHMADAIRGVSAHQHPNCPRVFIKCLLHRIVSRDVDGAFSWWHSRTALERVDRNLLCKGSSDSFLSTSYPLTHRPAANKSGRGQPQSKTLSRCRKRRRIPRGFGLRLSSAAFRPFALMVGVSSCAPTAT